jgi:putative hemolysin
MSDTRDGVFSLDWTPKGPVRRAVFNVARPLLERALALPELERQYRLCPRGVDLADFTAGTLRQFGVSVRLDASDRLRLPQSGPALVVANHPFGAVEGIALAGALKSVRPDVKVLANFLLGRIPELRDLFLLVDPFGRPGASHANASGLRRALAWLKAGGMLVVFPAGEVASFRLSSRGVVDPAWSATVAGLARRSRASTIPVFIPGRNGIVFQAAGLLHPGFRTAMLPRELLNSRGRTIELRVGTPVPASRLAELGDDTKAIAYLRDRTEILASRAPVSPAIQPRRTPAHAVPIVPPVDPALLAAEIAALPEEDLLIEADDVEVRVARAAAIPSVLREIGRLREVTFRDVGEGTGREIDLDAFDAGYLHLFIWNKREREIVGAYRLGPTDELLAASGIEGLYTASLFRYDARLFEAMGPALEMGRSWVRTDHQKSYVGLMLLWKGIGEFVARHPRYATLFGPVSISAEYRSLSQQIIVAFMERNKKMTRWASWVRPTTPFKARHRAGKRLDPSNLASLDDVSAFISEIEADQKGVPVLLKQYLKLDGRLLGYNVDPDFSNVLDVLIVVDLRRTAPKILKRYLGAANLERFQAWQREHTSLSRAL